MESRLTSREPPDIISGLSRADELYRDRDYADAVNESVALLSGLPGGREAFEVQWRLGRALFFLGQQATSHTASQQLHRAGISAGERARAANLQRVEGRFWLGVNLALYAQLAGGLKGFRALQRARGELARAGAISEAYHGAGARRVLGRIDHKAPWFAGGSFRRARDNYDRALELAPNNSVTLIYAAELALDMRESERAAELLERVIALPVDPEWRFENLRDKQTARELLEPLDRLYGSFTRNQ